MSRRPSSDEEYRRYPPTSRRHSVFREDAENGQNNPRYAIPSSYFDEQERRAERLREQRLNEANAAWSRRVLTPEQAHRNRMSYMRAAIPNRAMSRHEHRPRQTQLPSSVDDSMPRRSNAMIQGHGSAPARVSMPSSSSSPMVSTPSVSQPQRRGAISAPTQQRRNSISQASSSSSRRHSFFGGFLGSHTPSSGTGESRSSQPSYARRDARHGF